MTDQTTAIAANTEALKELTSSIKKLTVATWKQQDTLKSQQKFHQELLKQMKEVHQKSELLTSKIEAANSQQNEEAKDD